ncbi:leucine-rich repeat-containing G-protein coupled receptor 5-like protein [Leptotrombidium deliense]|uniref:Leucine-rich repeat-containing G-protein coupled receptor 5-like protein n=1 Tax=Leptotrombidium deliense TaxID=299467 RepID=A0A443S8R4_9ACAR|nr:leucine-rich repeat-containing G-protein coupled receptor 5-like protein [Leptotrombidium deliense]
MFNFTNGYVVIVLLFGIIKLEVLRLLVFNLAIADFFTGLFLVMLAIVDASTLGELNVHAITMLTSNGFKLAGFLGVLSSELSVYTDSVYTLAVITM